MSFQSFFGWFDLRLNSVATCLHIQQAPFWKLSTAENREKLDKPIFGGRWSWSLVVVAIRGRVLEIPQNKQHGEALFFLFHFYARRAWLHTSSAKVKVKRILMLLETSQVKFLKN